MQSYPLIYPMFAMVLLTFVTLVRLFVTRASAVSAGTVDAKYFQTYQDGSETEAGAKLARHFSNLFEAPTLFYLVCLAAMVTGQASGLLVGLAWFYVLLRVIHSFIHTGRNQLQPRIAAYFSSWAVLLAIWCVVVWGVSRSA